MKSLRGIACAVLLAALGCATPSQSDEAAVAQLRADLAAHDAALEDTEAMAARLSGAWRDVAARYEEARDEHAKARATYEAASRGAEAAGRAARAASAEYQVAAERWRVFQELVLVAARIDADNFDAYRSWNLRGQAASLDCSPVSTASFRHLLRQQGVDLTGLDVDHIVPRSLGGADHPSNYQLLPSSVNRSLGNTWNMTKCAAAGDRCAEAIAVSKRCGRYSGLLPD